MVTVYGSAWKTKHFRWGGHTTNARATPLTPLSSSTAERSLSSDLISQHDGETGTDTWKRSKLTENPPNSASTELESMATPQESRKVNLKKERTHLQGMYFLKKPILNEHNERGLKYLVYVTWSINEMLYFVQYCCLVMHGSRYWNQPVAYIICIKKIFQLGGIKGWISKIFQQQPCCFNPEI